MAVATAGPDEALPAGKQAELGVVDEEDIADEDEEQLDDEEEENEALREDQEEEEKALLDVSASSFVAASPSRMPAVSAVAVS